MTSSPPDQADSTWRSGGASKQRWVGDMFDRIATPYDRLNNLISLGRCGAWRRRTVREAQVKADACIVDLGTGTGDLAFDFLRALDGRGTVIGVDIAANMMRVAAAKRTAGDAYHLVRGSAESSGLQDAIADAVSMAWVLRNVGTRTETYREVLRLLKPGGTFVCLEMSHPESWFSKAGYAIYRHLIMPVLARFAGGDLSAYRYLAQSSDAFPGRATITAEMESAGFVEVTARPLMLGSLAIHRARRPA